MNRSHLFCFGLGYTGMALAHRLIPDDWQVSGTCRDPASAKALADEGITAFVFDGADAAISDGLMEALANASHVLISVPPSVTEGDANTASVDPVFRAFGKHLAKQSHLLWIGYLSTTGVYGNTDGQEVAEDSPTTPTGPRGERRVAAENDWLSLFRDHDQPVHLFRLPGIYGPGRSVIDQVRANKPRLIHKPDHLFNRIHVEDIARVLQVSMTHPNPGAVYNICDDVPATPADVATFACDLLGVAPPPLIPFDEARKTMSDMALSFWRDNRRVSNARIKKELGVNLRYPSYQDGLKAILDLEPSG